MKTLRVDDEMMDLLFISELKFRIETIANPEFGEQVNEDLLKAYTAVLFDSTPHEDASNWLGNLLTDDFEEFDAEEPTP